MSKPPPFQRFQVTMVKSYVKPLPLDAPNASRTLTAPASENTRRPQCPCFVGPFLLLAESLPDAAVLCKCLRPLTRDTQPRILPISYSRRATQTLQRTEIVGQCRNSLVLMTEETRQAHLCGVWSFHGRSAARGVRVVLFRRLCGERGATVSRFQIQLQLRLH